uniref:AT-hook containing transcription factor 1 n=1 Tax=Callorhinchus milii TaxID=7868 RepID=A0A4W3JUN0_CALMI|eukprot:gi/632961155/ref/XP_007896600.1/ PREDICTED: protein ELYS [Callorhinchus milii]
MCELAAQVTSSLLQFPEVTLQALVDDESMQDEALQGKVAIGRNGLAWLASGAHLELVNSVTGERLSAYRFRGIGEQPPTILAIKEFCWLKRTGLLIGLKESEGSILCLYDLGVSRVVKAVFLPGKVTAIEPIINHGGASASTQRLYQSLRWFFGIAAVVTDTGHVLLVDLCLDFSCSQSEQEPADLEVVNRSPAEIPRMRENVVREGRHLCFQLQSPSGVGATALSYVARTNQLAVGFSNGYVQLWNLKTLKKEYYSQLEGGKVPVFAFTFQEPENDPRNCCYLWAVQSAQDSEGDVVSLHLLQLAFGDRKNLTSGQILYEGLEYCEERYTQDLTLGMFSSRTRNTNARLLGCQTVEKFRNHADRDESMNEATSPDTSVSIFSWQVNTYGQRKPSSYLGIFDINRWYHAQMPDSLRAGEQLHNCPYFALWSLDAVVGMTFPHYLLDVLVHERNLSRGVAPSYPPPEQFFNPSTYNFDATCLLNSGLVHITCPGFQKETLNYLKKTGPCLSKAIPDGYSRCLMAGLLSPRLADVHPSSLTQEEQLEAILSAAVESSSLGLITGCIKQWTAEEQPRSAASLRFVLEWTWKKITRTKEELDNICVPLFDGSCNFIDSHTLQSLQHCQMLLSNLTTIVNCFLTEAQELTERGLVDLMNKRTVGSLIAQYAQVVLWFCRAGLLPEGSDDVDVLQLSRPVYNYPVIQNYYTNRRQKLERLSRGRWCSDCLMIDGVVSEIGDHLEQLWRQDEGGTGKYPPSTLHALLDVYLLENVNETTKHTIAIYLILDILSSVSNKNESSIESFPPAFAVPVGLVNLIQGFWLLDHNDHENALDRILHPATSRSISSWQHIRIIQALMCQGEHSKALRYLQAMKPSMSSISELKLHLTVLLFNRCVVEAWNLLQQNASRINLEGLLMHMYELCQEMGLMEDLFKLPFNTTEQECLEKFLTTSGSLQNYEFLLVHHLQRANYVPAIQLNQSLKMNLNDHDPQVRERTAARNSILEQYGKVLPKVQRKLATERANPYRSAVFREVKRPKPLSTMAKRTTSGNVLTRATFINTVLSKVNEVWQGNEKGNHSPINSPGNNGAPSANRSTELCDPFVGTPISKSVGKFSRLLDSLVELKTQSLLTTESTLFTQSKASPSWMTTSPLQSYTVNTGYLTAITKASELKLLQTPPVVKRTRAFTTSESAFASFTPQSILRSSLRPTPLGSPSASPSRSLTPPLRAKETKISFLEEKLTVRWTNGVAAADEIKLLSSASHIPRTPSIESWPSTTDNQPAYDQSPDRDIVSEQVEMFNISSADKEDEKIEIRKEHVDSSARTEEWSLEEYEDAAEDLDRGDAPEELMQIEEKILSGAPMEVEGPAAEVEGPTAEVEGPAAEVEGPAAEVEGPAAEVEGPAAEVEGPAAEVEGHSRDEQQVEIFERMKEKENLSEDWAPGDEGEAMDTVDNLYTSEELILPTEEKSFSCSPTQLEEQDRVEVEDFKITDIITSALTSSTSFHETVLSSHNFAYTNESEDVFLGMAQQPLPITPQESEGMLESEGILKPATADIEPVVIVDDFEDMPSTQPKDEENESMLSKDDDSDVEIMEDNAVCSPNEPLATLLPVNTQQLQDVEDGFETESPKEELCVVELSQPDPVEFAGECAFEFEEQHSNGVEAVQEPEGYDVDLIGEHHVEENFTLILDGADEAEPVLTLDANHQPAFSENENVILSQSSETKTGNPDRENSEVSSAEAETEEEPPIKSISLVLGDQGPLEDQHNLSEALPYLPTPIKEATTENLIDVLEDTKQVGESEMEELSELISLPDQADTPMTGRILRSGSFKSKPVKKSQTDEAREVFSEDLKPNQIEAVATPTSVRGQSIKVTEVKGQDDEQNVLMEMQDDKLEKTAVMTPRRSTRKTAAAAGEILGTTLFPKDAVADQNIAGILPTSKVTRRTIASRKDIQERTFAVGELALEQQGEAVSTVRSTRRTMAGRADALLGPEEVDIGQQTEAIFTSTRKKNRKSTIETPCKLPSTLEMSQQDSALSTPSRRTRSRAHLVTVKDISEVTPNVERNSRTSRRRGASAVESTEPPIPVDNVDDQPEEQLTVTFTHMPTRRRPGETPVSQAIGLTEKNYGFSSPHTRSTRKLKAEKTPLSETPEQQPPEFVFATPLTRSSRRIGKTTLKSVQEQDLRDMEENVPKVTDVQQLEDIKNKKPESKPGARGKTTRLRVKKSSRTAGNTVSWSPPPVEIKFLSPLVSPVDAPVNKREASEDDSGSIKHRMTLRHKRTKVISAFRKPVTRRKIIQRK